MRNFFAKLKRKKLLSYDSNNGVKVITSWSKKSVIVNWQNITKIILVHHFEEYSGYFLTDEYKSKQLYKDIYIDCSRNIVKIRTGGAPTVKTNTSTPFLSKHGTTSIFNVAFVEYKDLEGNKNLYATHFNEDSKKSLIADFKEILKDKSVLTEERVEGFEYILKL